MSVAWSRAFDTPFKWTKQIASHFGGTGRAWPSRGPATSRTSAGFAPSSIMSSISCRQFLKHGHPCARDSRRHQAEADRRREHGLHVRPGERQGAVEARHAVFRDGRQPWDLSRRLVWRHHPARAALVLGGKLLPPINGYKWELYNLAEDYSQYNDLADKNPDKLKELQALFLTEAAKYQVLPLDNTAFRASRHRDRARLPGKLCSLTRVRMPGFPSAMLPAFWTRTTPSPPKLRFPRAARKE